jgi:hypothetical protein
MFIMQLQAAARNIVIDRLRKDKLNELQIRTIPQMTMSHMKRV